MTINAGKPTLLSPECPNTDQALWALVPVKETARAKQRLQASLGTDREAFAQAMFRDVIRALKSSELVTHIVVVTADPNVAALDEAVLVVDENKHGGLNAAVEQGVDAIRNLGGRQVAVFPADIPLITGAEIDSLLNDFQDQRSSEGEHVVGIVPSRKHSGTNFLCFQTAQPFSTRYGPGSFELHKAQAVACLQQPILLYSDAISLDIDERQDLDEFLSFCQLNPVCRKTESWQFLKDRGYVKNGGNERIDS